MMQIPSFLFFVSACEAALLVRHPSTLFRPVSAQFQVCTRTTTVRLQESPSDSASPGLIDALKMRARIFQESNAAGLGFKQCVADAIAGEYDKGSTEAELRKIIGSAPVVMFSWTVSPACKKAKRLLALAGVEVKVVELDQPWSEGNPKRAQLGRMTGKSSVPSIWINGEYIGGCDDGPTDSAPGLIDYTFQGKLAPLLTK